MINQQICNHSFNQENVCSKCLYENKNRIFKKPLDIDYISDIHLDFWMNSFNPQQPKFKKQIEYFIENILIPKTKEVLVLAGDQGHYILQDYFLLEKLKNYYKYIILVPGNHDYYLIGRNKSRFKYKSEDRLFKTIERCTELENIHYLTGKTIEIKGFKIGGLGMWHDESYADKYYPEKNIYNEWCNIMNDSKLILNGYAQKIGYNVSKPSFDYREKFKTEYKKLQTIEQVDLMITHYGPKIPDVLSEKYKDVSTTFYYFDGLKDLNRIKPQYWIHGHIHNSYSELYNNTEILCNPLGYPSENTYNEIKTITLY